MSASPSPPPPSTKKGALFLSDDEDDEDVEMSTQPTKPRRNSALFFSDSEDEDLASTSKEKDASGSASIDPDIDALFNEINNDDGDDNDDLAYKPLDMNALRKAAEARHARAAPRPSARREQHQILPTSSPPPEGDDDDGGKKRGKRDKPKRTLVKLDEELLLGERGFSKLVEDTKGFKVSGKGKEEKDLQRLLRIYQFWAHEMYPKGQFRDTVEKVEKLCHSKRMAVAMSVWKDEAHGVYRNPDDGDDEDAPVEKGKEQEAEGDAEPDTGGRARDSSPSRPPSSASERMDDDDDFDVDKLIQDMEDARDLDKANASASTSKDTAMEVDEDEMAMWGAMEREMANDAPPRAPAKKVVEDWEDDDMMDLMREMEGGGDPKPQTTQAAPAKPLPSSPRPNEDDLEDLYI